MAGTKMLINDFKINRNVTTQIITKMSQRSVANAANQTVTRVRKSIRSQDRIDTGAMLRDTHAEFARDSQPMSAKATVTLGGGIYGSYQEFGTRAHGPRRAPFMVFRIRGKGPLIFAKWVRGVTPGKFMQDAYAALTVRDFIAPR